MMQPHWTQKINEAFHMFIGLRLVSEVAHTLGIPESLSCEISTSQLYGYFDSNIWRKSKASTATIWEKYNVVAYASLASGRSRAAKSP